MGTGWELVANREGWTRVNEISGSKRAENVYSIMRPRAASSFPRGGIVGNAS